MANARTLLTEPTAMPAASRCALCGAEHELAGAAIGVSLRPSAPPTIDRAARSSIRATRTCPFCAGSGKCGRCEGEGTRPGRRRWLRPRRTVPCGVCGGSCACELCSGRGRIAG